eukprot:3129800-Pleurochrysis_carterae.AAC.1
MRLRPWHALEAARDEVPAVAAAVCTQRRKRWQVQSRQHLEDQDAQDPRVIRRVLTAGMRGAGWDRRRRRLQHFAEGVALPNDLRAGAGGRGVAIQLGCVAVE